MWRMCRSPAGGVGSSVPGVAFGNPSTVVKGGCAVQSVVTPEEDPAGETAIVTLLPPALFTTPSCH